MEVLHARIFYIIPNCILKKCIYGEVNVFKLLKENKIALNSSYNI